MDHLIHQYGCDVTAGLNLKLGYAGFVDSCSSSSTTTVNHSINFIKRNIIIDDSSLDELPALLSLSLVPADHTNYTSSSRSTPAPVLLDGDDQAACTIKQQQQQVVFALKHRDDAIAGDQTKYSAGGQSTVSGSFDSNSTGLSHVKRERSSYEDQAEDYNCLISNNNNNNNNNKNKGSVRKKLRLKEDQAQVLEERFKQQSTLNPKQKQALARQLNLSSRQVEVWYQNRRARTKLKKTELDYEYLKKCCETLTEENRRLVKELKELKAGLKQAQPNNGIQLPAATLSICPSL